MADITVMKQMTLWIIQHVNQKKSEGYLGPELTIDSK